MDVFVYGTLTDPATASEVLDEFEYHGPAELVGLHRVDGRYPTLGPGGTTDGRLLQTQEADTLDQYEGVDRNLYVRLSLPLDGSDVVDTVDCYIGHPEKLDAPVEWPGDGAFAERVRRYCRENDVVIRSESLDEKS